MDSQRENKTNLSDYKDVQTKIKLKLFQISEAVKFLNDCGDNDISRYAEGYFQQIFNILFAKKGWGFSKAQKVNQQTYDIYDEKNQVCIQITSNKRIEKRNDTIKSFRKNEFYKQYTTLILFVITKSKRRRKHEGELNFTFHEYNITDIAGLIEGLTFDKVKAIWDLLNFDFYETENKDSGFDFEVYLNEFSKYHILEPTFYRKIKRYALESFREVHQSFNRFYKVSYPSPSEDFFTKSHNEAYKTFELILKNTGSNVIEDWRVTFELQEEFRKFNDNKYLSGVGFGVSLIDPHHLRLKRTYCDEEERRIYFIPLNNQPFVQKNKTSFHINIIPFSKEYSIPIKWSLLARDFNKEGKLMLKIKPKFKDEFEYVYVQSELELKEDEIISIRETEFVA